MSKKYAQVFIATTKGLVQVLSITPLDALELSSVATIAGTSQLAGISGAYQSFVEKPQGIISHIFGGHAYRINLSAGIDQGESWQLGVFIAHYLHVHGCLSGANDAQIAKAQSPSNDVVFIATGKLDTLNHSVLAIEALAKKCLRAEPNIAQWLQQQNKVCFLVPRDNARQPIPNTLVSLTPIASLAELYYICSLLEIPVKDLNLDKQTHGEEAITIAHKGVLIEAELQGWNWSKARLFTCSSLLLLIIIFMVTIFNTENSDPQVQNAHNDTARFSSGFALTGVLSDNKRSCDEGGISILQEGTLGHDINAKATNLVHLCELYIVTSPEVSSVWLVSDTKAIIPLAAIVLDKEQLNNDLLSAPHVSAAQWGVFSKAQQPIKWRLPLPSNQSQTRKYTLMAFIQKTDAADLSSLDSFLYSLEQAGESHKTNDLQRWITNTQSTNTVFMLTHELAIQK